MFQSRRFDKRSIKEKSENAVKTKRPSGKLIRKAEGDKEVFYSWGSVRKGIGLLIFYGTFQRDAAERMQFTNNILSEGPGQELTDFGDEAYSWKSTRGDFAGIRFRKSNVYIEVTAPSVAMAITSLQSVSQHGDHVFEVPMFDLQKMPASAGACSKAQLTKSIWDLAGSSSSTLNFGCPQ